MSIDNFTDIAGLVSLRKRRTYLFTATLEWYSREVLKTAMGSTCVAFFDAAPSLFLTKGISDVNNFSFKAFKEELACFESMLARVLEKQA